LLVATILAAGHGRFKVSWPDGYPELSPEQLRLQARQRERLSGVMKADAVDRAWKAARRTQ
jgi:hypothetical protein